MFFHPNQTHKEAHQVGGVEDGPCHAHFWVDMRKLVRCKVRFADGF